MRVIVWTLCAAMMATSAAAKPLQVVGVTKSAMSILDRGTVHISGEHMEGWLFQVFEKDIRNAAYVRQRLTADCSGKRIRFDEVEAFADDGSLVRAGKYANPTWEPAGDDVAGGEWLKAICGPPNGIQMPIDFIPETFVPTAREQMKAAD
ncbi:MAG: hypothetical protein BGN86_07075 [Caulobacterales bacterium 68-7]|nr:MAG: hypothetical protein BGN86_07075 [Caulobacterales bacterium 68-7]